MARLSGNEQVEIRDLLQEAVVKCSERCLYQSAKWAAEMLNSLPTPDYASPTDTEIDSFMSTDTVTDRQVPTGVVSQNQDPREARLEAGEVHKYLLAKTFFDCREYDRCAAVFLPMTLPKGPVPSDDSASSAPDGTLEHELNATVFGPDTEEVTMDSGFPKLSQKALFLALYAKYMAGEKRKDEESEMILGPNDTGAVINRELVGITQALEARLHLHRQKGDSQGWLEYLYGIVLAKTGNTAQAKESLLASVNRYWYNWGAWQELGALIGSEDEQQALAAKLPENIISFIFNIYSNQSLHKGGDELFNGLKALKPVFPKSSFLRSQKALLHYHNKYFEKAEQRFSKILRTDPLRLEDTDTYSNILYVMDKRAVLSYLAQLTTAIDKFRPETCCVVGNYHAMKSEHEKAVTFFRRALTLDRNCASAWTLMGHEYMEMKNTQTAIECYRRAVDANRRDFRAWYGLGQTYEILDMHYYSLYYYKRAATLAPLDAKMWNAVASALTQCGRPFEAIKAYKRCLLVGSSLSAGSSFGSNSQKGASSGTRSMDPDVLISIAELYERLGNIDETVAYMELTLAQEEGSSPDDDPVLNVSLTGKSGSGAAFQGTGVTPTTSKARLWLARHYKGGGTAVTLRKAHMLANELCQDGYEVEEAKALVKEIRALSAMPGFAHLEDWEDTSLLDNSIV